MPGNTLNVSSRKAAQQSIRDLKLPLIQKNNPVCSIIFSDHPNDVSKGRHPWRAQRGRGLRRTEVKLRPSEYFSCCAAS